MLNDFRNIHKDLVEDLGCIDVHFIESDGRMDFSIQPNAVMIVGFESMISSFSFFEPKSVIIFSKSIQFEPVCS